MFLEMKHEIRMFYDIISGKFVNGYQQFAPLHSVNYICLLLLLFLVSLLLFTRFTTAIVTNVKNTQKRA